MRQEDWIKVEDRLPEAKYRNNEGKGYSDGVLILIREIMCYTIMDAIYDYEAQLWYDRNDDVVYGNITHWMPIVLPKED